jgi:phospho-N-acetylmuramoyl-pentapeptide-transferase
MLLRLLNLSTQAADAPLDASPLDSIPVRLALAAGTSFVAAVLLGRPMIAWLRARFREPIKSASPAIQQLHAAKRSTPTMGGLFIVGGIAAGTLLFADWLNPFVLVALLLTFALASIGYVDDLAKLRTAARGLSARKKLSAQTVVAVVAAVAIYHLHQRTPGALELHFPLAAGSIDLSWWFIPLAVVVLVGASNAVNLTDGLDGLAGGCLLFATGSMTALAYASGDSEWARYLHITHVPGASELAVVAGGMLGAVLGFLWFNCYPASVFMGDTGSLPLGGLLGLLAIACRQEIIFAVVAAVFAVEAASVVLQVGSFKLRGRRLLLCAPLHHHFQLRGWPENKIVVRFWIAAALAAIAGLALVKLGSNTLADGPEAQRVARRAVEYRNLP